MIWPQVETVAQMAIGHILNSLPEGLLIALFAWLLLHLLPRQNSGTRFAVWFVALLAVAGLPLAGVPLIGGSNIGRPFLATGAARPLVTLPESWGYLLFLVWLLAVCVAMLRLAIGLWRLRGLRKSCTAIDPSDLAPAVQSTIAQFSRSSRITASRITGRSVTLATSERVSVPAAIGFFRPMIVIPAWALRELPADELNIVLLHESAHLDRWDDWTNLLQKIVRAIFFFHPAVWWIESRLSLEREMACDDAVLAATANPRGYAQCLIALLEKSVARRGWAMAQAAVHRACEASLRLARILDATRPDARRVWKPALGLVSGFSLLCLIAVTRAPQFVAFAPNARTIHSENLQTAALRALPFQSASVIPASLHSNSSSSLGRSPRPGAQVAAHQVLKHPAGRVIRLQATVPLVVAARATAETEQAPAYAVIAHANLSVVPHSEELFIIRTAQRVGPNSWVWSVSLWRVVLVNPAQAASAASKT